jgi:hypothetical protein
MIARTSFCCLFLMLAGIASSYGDVLDEIAPGSVVCVGKEAPKEERDAAALVLEALKTRSASARLMNDEEVLESPVSESGSWHVIVVGTPMSNAVLLAYPSYWALDRELHYAPFGNMPAASFTETRGYYVGGFGYFFAGRNVGFVEFDRSPFYSEKIFFLPDDRKAARQTSSSLRFLIRVTGSSPEGVALAAKRFVETWMLYGVALGPPRWPRAHDLWNLDDEKIKPDPPEWLPRGDYSLEGPLKGETGRLSFLGWLMADRSMYAGFLELTGCKPVQIWRAKYTSEESFFDFNHSPHHRASGNELLVIQVSSREAQSQALGKLGGKIPMKIGGMTCYRAEPASREKRPPEMKEDGRETSAAKDLPGTILLPATIQGATYVIVANFDPGYAEKVLAEMERSLGPTR